MTGQIDLRGGGWVILLAIAISAALLLWRASEVLVHRDSRAIGDGSDPATYGFDLSNYDGNRDVLAGGGLPKDGLPALNLPAILAVDAVESRGRSLGGRLLVSSDDVVGVSIRRAARAYPIRILNWHEVVNDTLGGVPIAVTYSPLCDAVVVFDRRVAGDTLRFGISGLLYNSAGLLYDVQADPIDESLWCPLQCRAVSGPAERSDAVLEPLPADVTTWVDWRSRYPETTVLAPDPVMSEQYKRDPYGSYFGTDRLHFPVAPAPPAGKYRLKTPVLAIRAGGVTEVFPAPLIRSRIDAGGEWRSSVGGIDLAFRMRRDSDRPIVRPVDPAARIEVFHAFWFAWFAMHPDDARLADEPAASPAAAGDDPWARPASTRRESAGTHG